MGRRKDARPHARGAVEGNFAVVEPAASTSTFQHSTKPGRMAGLRRLRYMSLLIAHDEVALSLSRLLPLRLHQCLRVWDAGEQSVANRRDELRRHTNLGRLLVVVGKANQLRFGPATAD